MAIIHQRRRRRRVYQIYLLNGQICLLKMYNIHSTLDLKIKTQKKKIFS